MLHTLQPDLHKLCEQEKTDCSLVPLKALITHRYTLDQAVEAFRTFDGATTGKCVFVMD